MKLGYQLNLKQEQKLVMTPKLQQAIKILQLSILELNDYVEEEMIENPLLELDDYNLSTGSYSGYNDEEVNYENFIAKELTLDEHLTQQLNLVVDNSLEREIGYYIIGNLDESGFFNDLSGVAKELGVTEEEVNKVLKKIKGFEPAGIATSGIKESLVVQLDNLKGSRSKEEIRLAQEIVVNYLQEVSKNQIKKIAGKLKIDLKKVQSLVDLIKLLAPIPADKFEERVANNYLEPDVIIKKVNKRYIIIMNQASFPTLRINKYYKNLLRQKKAEGNLKDYMEEKLDAALWLIKSIGQRRRTIHNIVQEIINLQREFLDKGLKYLKPLRMKDIAKKIDMHESTVSRATDNKYVQTPQGLFPMKFFFSEGIEGIEDDLSAVSVKKIMRDYISCEDKSKPLSDQKLASKLQEEGINIARRTVAKYRKGMKIPSSRKRKRYN